MNVGWGIRRCNCMNSISLTMSSSVAAAAAASAASLVPSERALAGACDSTWDSDPSMV